MQSDEVIEIVTNGLQPLLKGGKNTLIIIPDSTRTLPLRLLFPLINQIARQQKCHIDYLIALGTHPPLSNTEIEQLLGEDSSGKSEDEQGIRIINHDWMNKHNLSCLGKITAAEVSEITGGLLEIEIPVVINKLIHFYDQIVICGPVFPHEVAGFSGGEKYLFPGIAGEEIIHITHWLGALSTSMDTIGKADTLVRKIIHKASSFVKTPIVNMAFCLKGRDVFGVFIGEMKETWSEASKLSAQINITHVPSLYKSVMSIPSNIYYELWTAAKAMYKLEPAVADGGELIIYAPHI
ncbi:MAG: lactate racemase domain-containing protein, partial [Anaerolineaceae bacterium]|nr:lactate racemase domain-containing protein [Anaerolineaceae bacterium]